MKNACTKCALSIGDPSPPLSTLVDKRNSHDKMEQAFPLRFCILQVIKNWTVGRPGNKANQTPLYHSHMNNTKFMADNTYTYFL